MIGLFYTRDVAGEEDPMARRVIENPNLTPTYGLSRAVEVTGGRTVYIGGQVASKGMKAWTPGDGKPTDDASVVARGDFKGQVEFVFRRLKDTCEAAGGSLDHVVKLTMYLTDMSQYATLRGIRNQMFNGPVYPVMTVLGVKELSHPDFLLEIDAVMVID